MARFIEEAGRKHRLALSSATSRPSASLSTAELLAEFFQLLAVKVLMQLRQNRPLATSYLRAE
jgi:hypothetical protein